MPRGPGSKKAPKFVGVSAEHKEELREYVANHARRSAISPAAFEVDVRKFAERGLGVGKLPMVYKLYIRQLRLEMTDLRTFEEQHDALLPKRKARSNFGLRKKRPKTEAVVLHKGTPMTLDGVTGDTTGKTYPTFGGGGDLQILTSGTLPSDPPKVFSGPLLPYGYETGDDLSLFGGPMYLAPVGIQSPSSGWKVVPEQVITPDRLKTWSGRKRQDYGGQQGQVMGGVSAATAVKYAFQVGAGIPEQAKKLSDHDWEWLHLVAFSMGGIDSIPQQAANLVVGTYHANTEMILYENAIKRLVEEGGPLGVRVRARLILHSHVSDRIEYTVVRRPTVGVPREVTFHTNPLAFYEPASGLEKLTYEALKKILF